MSETKRQKENIPARPGYCEIIALTVMIITAAIFAYDHYFAQKIYVLDLQSYLRTQKALLVAGEIDETQWRLNLEKIELLLDEKAAHAPNVILMGDAVLRNGKPIRIEE